MKKNLLLFLLIFMAFSVQAQTGLDSIIVEKYYVSDLNDSTGSSGILPVGSVTYRFYADMAPGYNFQMAYGSPTHILKITTSTSFFNNTDYGSIHPIFTSGNAKKNTVMLDSWISMGAACSGFWGILKTEDDGLNIFENKDDLLKNNSLFSGLPLTEQDGMLAGTVPATSVIGNLNTDVLNDGSADGDSLGTDNGSWYLLGGVIGPTENNRVLFAQITTNGVLHYELNVLLGKDLGGGASISEKYVAFNPADDEISDSKYYLSGTLIPPALNPGVGITAIRSANTSVSIFPNPVEDFLTLEITIPGQVRNTSYRIINSSGQVVINKVIGSISDSYRENIPLAFLYSGVYTLVLTTDSETSVRKIMKQ